MGKFKPFEKRVKGIPWKIRCVSNPRLPLKERFENKLKIMPSGCWEWQTRRHKDGYGQFWYNNKTVVASRMAYEIYKEPIPEGLQVCHTCDNPPCCNPAHLFLGTLSDNMQDAQKKGRRPYAPHPSVNYYTKHKCRCDECKALFRVYRRASYERQLEREKAAKLLAQ